MASLIRMLSIGKEKKRSPPAHDIEAIKRSISRPRALAPKHVIDARIENQKARRLGDQERRYMGSSTPSMAQPSPATTQRHRKASQAALRKVVEVEFAERNKELPPTPTREIGNPNTVTQARGNSITFTLDRKSVTSSFWCCGGPNEQGSSGQIVAQTTCSNNVMAGFVQSRPISIFRDGEYGQLGELFVILSQPQCDNDPADSSVPRCGRDCPRCLAQMKRTSRRKASESKGGSEEPIPKYRVRVLEDPEAAAEDPAYQRLTDAEIEFLIFDELESLLNWDGTRSQSPMTSVDEDTLCFTASCDSLPSL